MVTFVANVRLRLARVARRIASEAGNGGVVVVGGGGVMAVLAAWLHHVHRI